MLYIYFNYSSLHRLRQAILVSYMVNGGLTELDIDGENLEHANYYLPSPTSQLRAILGGLQVRYEDFIFIDAGSGKGGALLLASEFPFRKIIGVEFSHELNEIAQENVRHYGSESQKCKDLEAICIDAALYPIPPKPSVFYFLIRSRR